MDDTKLLTPHFINVKKIKTISLFLDEYNIPQDVIFKIDFNRTYNIDVTQNLVALNLGVTYSIPNGESSNRKVLECFIHNLFEVENIKAFVDEHGVVKLPLDMLSSLVGLSISQSRAVLSIHTAGTAFGETLIPVINPIEFTKKLFDEVV
jgi:hypothetical protein